MTGRNDIRILLVHPPFGTGDDKRPPDIFDPHFPWGLGYISGILDREGYDARVFDIYAHQWDKKEVAERLKKESFDIVMITAMATQYAYVKWFSRLVKDINPGARIVVGGQLATFSWEVVLRNMLVDLCVIGEGEITTIDLLENLGEPSRVKGIAYRNGNEPVKTEPRELIKDLGEIPEPVFDKFRMDIYRTNKLYIHNKSAVLYKKQKRPHVMAMITGRGCPFRCNFCSRTFRTIRIKSLDSILREIDFFIDKYDIGGINFVDELLFLKQDMIDALAGELGKRGILWNGQARVDTINLDRLSYYKKNGLVSIGFGIESGSPDMLKMMNKGITRERIEEVIRRTIEAGLHLKMTLIFGYPGESEDTVRDTVEMFKGLGHPGRRFCIFTPLPGSVAYNMAIEQGLIEDEDAYLSSIYEGYWRTVVNMTDFSDGEVDVVRKKAEADMRENYKEHIMSLPEFDRDKHFLICEEDFEKDFINEKKGSV
ncbi:MAG: radical SAM protein [Candidatus Omnitrophica bacterium]|nr:radical SAM protein [Candidatus Omnitrophota bacterium]MDD5488825.1 radical SAM protein [Candidatus Omnitrophota bacterium]